VIPAASAQNANNSVLGSTHFQRRQIRTRRTRQLTRIVTNDPLSITKNFRSLRPKFKHESTNRDNTGYRLRIDTMSERRGVGVKKIKDGYCALLIHLSYAEIPSYRRRRLPLLSKIVFSFKL